MEPVLFETLVGKTLRKVNRIDDPKIPDHILLEVSDDELYVMCHRQDCCEDVDIEDIAGELDWLVGSPILKAEERSNNNSDTFNCVSNTWTFYELATINGSVTIRWHGISNGYYSEDANLYLIKKGEDYVRGMR